MTVQRRNATREFLMMHVKQNPGIHKSELCRLTGLAWGTVGHHLRVLAKDNSIRIFRVGRAVHIAPASLAEEMRTHPALLAPDARRILHTLNQSEFAHGPTKLARELGITTKQARKHLESLHDSGLAKSDGAYHPRFRATRVGQRLLMDELPSGRSMAPSALTMTARPSP